MNDNLKISSKSFLNAVEKHAAKSKGLLFGMFFPWYQRYRMKKLYNNICYLLKSNLPGHLSKTVDKSGIGKYVSSTIRFHLDKDDL